MPMPKEALSEEERKVEKKKRRKKDRNVIAPGKTRPGSAGGGRPASAERTRPGSAGADKDKQAEDRPGSAGRNRDKSVKPSVWLTDKKGIAASEKNLKAAPDPDKHPTAKPNHPTVAGVTSELEPSQW